MIRPTTLTYPNARAITIGYGTSGGINDCASRVDNLTDGATTLVNYAYLGLGTVVQTTYPQPGIQHTLLGSSGGNSPAGDIYWGLDLFGRIIDSRWFNTGTSADLDRIKYGYDRASNRIWRHNPVATAAGASFDEHYSNDGLQRLKDLQRGTLNGTNTAVTSPNFAQCWTLDPTGNWRGFNESTTGSSWTRNQTRTANTVNEITGITNSVGSAWVAPTYDAAGNMTTMPQPDTPTSSYGAVYDAWNRLVTIADAGTNLQKYEYDARNFRTQILTYTAGVLSETRHCYFTSGWRNIEERVDAGTTAERQFVWGARYIDDLVLRDRSSERLYTMQDANWNVTSIVNSSATIQERYAYSAYGYPSYFDSGFVSRVNSTFAWETLYCGYRYDRTAQLNNSRFREHHPLLGSWLSRDPLGYIDSMNLYEYVSSSTTDMIDPFGLGKRTDAINEINASMGIPRPTATPADMRFNEGMAVMNAVPVFVSTLPASAAQGAVNTGTSGVNAGISLLNLPLAIPRAVADAFGRPDLAQKFQIEHVDWGANLFVREDPWLRRLGGDLGLLGLSILFPQACAARATAPTNLLHVTRRPGGFNGPITSGGGGRYWMTRHASPSSWATDSGIKNWLLRLFRTGSSPKATGVMKVSGPALKEFRPPPAYGPIGIWKRVGGQYVSRQPGSLDMTTGLYSPAGPTMLELMRNSANMSVTYVLDPLFTLGYLWQAYSDSQNRK
jgi:RHS repeat-associated protein